MPPPVNPRNIVPKSVRKFRGISQYSSVFLDPMEYAQDLANVIVSPAGFLEKMRLPTLLSGQFNGIPKVDTLFNFGQANGTRQLIANGSGYLYYYTLANVAAPITSGVGYQGRMYYQDSNNLLFFANGTVTGKWTGTALQNWGIAQPPAPTLGIALNITSIQRFGGVVTVIGNTAPGVGGCGFPDGNGFSHWQLQNATPAFIASIAGTFVTITGVLTDPTLNGNFIISVTGGAFNFRYNQAGPDTALITGQGKFSLYFLPVANFTTTLFTVTNVVRVNGVTQIWFPYASLISAGDSVTIAGATTLTELNGIWPVASVQAGAIGSNQWITINQPGYPDILAGAVPGGTCTVAGGYTDVVSGRLYRCTWGNGTTGHESMASPPVGPIPTNAIPQGIVTDIRAFLTAPTPTDPQVDRIFWYGTLDGGSIWYLIPGPGINAQGVPDQSYPIANGLQFGDGITDSLFNTQAQANLVNNPPPIGKFLGRWQNRLYMVPNSAPQSLAYSGFEAILRGRPEESWPPNNAVQMQIGADVIQGYGFLMTGVVLWSSSGQMFMFKGTIEDIVANVPVSYSEYLEELPWELGIYSHDSVQSTPYGVVWFATDHTFHVWNGVIYEQLIGPKDLGINLRPFLQRITAGTETLIQSAYIQFYGRDWYIALLAIDGSVNYNRILFIDLSKEAADNMGCFISTIQADAITVREDANGQRHLVITQAGQLMELQYKSTATGGIHEAITATTGALEAYWVSGYDGNEESQVMKMYRWGRIITDNGGVNLLINLVDDEFHPITNPLQITHPPLTPGGKFTVNYKARRAQITIQFPSQDVDCSALELSLVHIPTSER